MKRNYSATLKKALDEALPAKGLSCSELEERIVGITKELKGPMGDAERIMLCATRAFLRKSLRRINYDG